MRERLAEHRVRTGHAYRPPRFSGARPLADDETCPTLFRYPGPEALLSLLAREPPPLAPPGAGVLWLSARPLEVAPAPVAHFGTVVVLEPLAMSPAVIEDAPWLYVATLRSPGDDAVVWLPPSRVAGELGVWDAVRSVEQAAAVLGDLEDERAAVADRLASYLEELSLLAGAGVAAPAGSWIDVPAVERRRLLAAHGIAGTFTR